MHAKLSFIEGDIGASGITLNSNWKIEWQMKLFVLPLPSQFVSVVIITVVTSSPFISSVTSHGEHQSVAHMPLCHICYATVSALNPAGNIPTQKQY